MSIKKWKEIRPLPCEVCGCCEYAKSHRIFASHLECKKYQKEVQTEFIYEINAEYYERLYNDCKCKKSYPSILKKIVFTFKKIRYYKEYLDSYIEDVRYHRFDD